MVTAKNYKSVSTFVSYAEKTVASGHGIYVCISTIVNQYINITAGMQD